MKSKERSKQIMSENSIEVLRNNLKGYRVKAGFTQMSAAEALGVSVTTFNRWEQKPEKLDFDKFIKLASLYSVPISDFFVNV